MLPFTLHPISRKVLDWSNRVDRDVAEISDEIRPFDGVKEALEKIHQYADIAIASSGNPQAVHPAVGLCIVST